jgi:hypothetical protein
MRWNGKFRHSETEKKIRTKLNGYNFEYIFKQEHYQVILWTFNSNSQENMLNVTQVTSSCNPSTLNLYVAVNCCGSQFIQYHNSENMI